MLNERWSTTVWPSYDFVSSSTSIASTAHSFPLGPYAREAGLGGTFVPGRCCGDAHTDGMNPQQATRSTLLVVEAFVAVTAFAGGLALMLGALIPDLSMVITPPAEYLEGSPFSSYLVPGLVLALVLGGLNAIAFVLLLQRRPSALFAAATAGYAALIWIFVQMMVIPFSFLQAVYFMAGAVELGLVMLLLGLLPISRVPQRRHTRSRVSGTVTGRVPQLTRPVLMKDGGV